VVTTLWALWAICCRPEASPAARRRGGEKSGEKHAQDEHNNTTANIHLGAITLAINVARYPLRLRILCHQPYDFGPTLRPRVTFCKEKLVVFFGPFGSLVVPFFLVSECF